jgi:hypothetical protein
MGLGQNDVNRIIGDTQNKAYQIWNGTRFTDLNNEFVDVRMYGAVGDGSNNDTQALKNALDSGCKNILFPNGFTFLLDNADGLYAEYDVNVPAGTVFKIDGTLISHQGKTITFVLLGDFGAFGSGVVNLFQGTGQKVFTFTTGNIWCRGLTFKGGGIGNNPWYWVCEDPGYGSVDSFSLIGCKFLNFCGYGYSRESTAGSSHYVGSTLIEGCEFQNIYNGSAILINDVSGHDRNTVIIGNSISGVFGNNSGDPFSGFGIAVAGFNVLPFNTTDCLKDLIVADNQIVSCSSSIHIEYCNRFILSGNKVDDVNANYYPTRPGEGGIVVYGCSNWSAIGNKVSNVTGDSANVWGFVARSGYDGAYQQSSRDYAIIGNSLEYASMLLDQQVQSNAIGGVQPYELTSSSRLDVIGNSINNGICSIYSTATLNVKGNSIVAPLSMSTWSVVSYYRNANVAALTVTIPHGSIGMVVGDTVCISGVGSGFDTQFATVINAYDGIAAFTYANVGANVGVTGCSGTVYVLKNALTIDASSSSTGNSDYNSVYRLTLNIDDNVACNVYGASSFQIKNVAANRYTANIQIRCNGNNFGIDGVSGSYQGLNGTNRTWWTSNVGLPTGTELILGDGVWTNVSGVGAHKEYVITAQGYVGIVGDTYAIETAATGRIKRNGATSWLGNPAAYSFGELVTLTNGGSSIVGLIQKLELSGGNEVMTVINPANGSVLDLTSVGGPGTVAPYKSATFIQVV